ncbi:MAG: TetR-like C-terminal domain-containing protein [Streptosporangiaceae bacterium]
MWRPGRQAVAPRLGAGCGRWLGALLERGRTAGELAADADLDMLMDMAYGLLYYRLLVGHAPLDEKAARSLAAELARSAR